MCKRRITVVSILFKVELFFSSFLLTALHYSTEYLWECGFNRYILPTLSWRSIATPCTPSKEFSTRLSNPPSDFFLMRWILNYSTYVSRTGMESSGDPIIIRIFNVGFEFCFVVEGAEFYRCRCLRCFDVWGHLQHTYVIYSKASIEVKNALVRLTVFHYTTVLIENQKLLRSVVVWTHAQGCLHNRIWNRDSGKEE